MKRTSVSLIGVGSLRCGPPVLSSIAGLCLESPLELRLYDANEERLDLMDRFAKRVFELTQSHHDVLYRPDLDEALDGTDAVVLSLYEDCARRMTGRTSARFLIQDDPEDGNKLYDLYGGDMNKPTPMTEVSEMTLAALSSPDLEEQTKDEALGAAMELVLDKVEGAKLLILSRSTVVDEPRARTISNWPDPLSEEDEVSMPHMILRWLNGDQELDDKFMKFGRSQFAEWLVSDLGAL